MVKFEPLSLSKLHTLSIGKAIGMTDVGSVRKTNEDNFLIEPIHNLVMVADGMGGHQAGDIASKEALLRVRDYIEKIGLENPLYQNFFSAQSNTQSTASFDAEDTWIDGTMSGTLILFDAIEFANSALYARNSSLQITDGSGMGTTLTGFWQFQKNGPIILFHVGDSRIYRYRSGEFSVLTRDQTLFQKAIDDGQVDDLPSRNILLQAMGPNESVTPEITSEAISENDIYLLCSDGLHGSVPHEVIARTLAKTNLTNLPQSCSNLIALAKEYGSRDNITVVVLVIETSIKEHLIQN